jgi:hypothetical protein
MRQRLEDWGLGIDNSQGKVKNISHKAGEKQRGVPLLLYHEEWVLNSFVTFSP